MWLDNWPSVGALEEPVSAAACESERGKQVLRSADALRGQQRVSDLVELKGSCEPPEVGAGK